MNEIDRAATMTLFQSVFSITETDLADVLASATVHSVASGDFLLNENDEEASEFAVLRGVLKTGVLDQEGHDTAFNFFVAPSIVSPCITRHANGYSRVHIQALTDARVIKFPAKVLNDSMVANSKVQCWGETVLRTDLIRRADKEWALAVLNAKERLLKFREEFPELERLIPHHVIASYLGITPVSLSRVRKSL